MVTRINGLLFYTSKLYYYQLDDDELRLAWLEDNIKHYKEYFERKNQGTEKEKWKIERKSYKKKLKTRLNDYKKLSIEKPHLFL